MPTKPRTRRTPAKLKSATVSAPIVEIPQKTQINTKAMLGSFEKNLVPALILVAAAIMSVSYFNYTTNEASARLESSFSISAFKKPTIIGLISSADRITKKFTFLAASSTQPIVLSVANLQNERAVARQFFTDYGKHFGVKSFATELKFLKLLTDEFGTKHLRYLQVYKGVPVFGAQMLVHVQSNLSVNSAGGRFVSNIGINVKPKISADKAKDYAREIAVNEFGMTKPNFSKARLYIFNESLINPNANAKNQLVWQMDVNDPQTYDRKILFLAATTGKLVYFLEGDRDATNRKIFHCNNGNDIDSCKLWDDEGLNGGRREGETATGFADVDNLYSFIGNAQSYYQDNFDLDGANGNGGTGRGGDFQVTSTYGLSYYVYPVTVSSTCPNATWDGSYIKFCQGVVSLPIVAHEYTHSVSDYAFGHPDEPGMTNAYETGAIEEAFADIFAMGIERYVNGASSWKVSLGTLGVIRDISSPSSTPGRALPSRFYDPNFYCGDSDKGGVHRNSTVISNMIYNLVNGADFNGCLIGAVDQDKVERILYNGRKFTFNTSEKFNDLYNDLNVACGLRYGGQGYECRQLRSAMQAAEINQPGACSGVARVKPACDMPRLDGNINTNINPLDNLPSNSLDVNIPDSVTQPQIKLPINTSPNPTNDEVVSSSPINLSVPAVISNPVAAEEIRTPSFSMVVTQKGNDATVTGKIDYYGTGAKCSGPRPYDPVIVRWGDAADEPSVTNGAFNAKHTYFIKNKTYTLTVSVYNSCYGMKTESKTITTAF